jgi:two-component system, OmpR family, sensor kinase
LSVLKNLDIDLPQSEKKTLQRLLSLYLFFTIVILGLTVSLYYTLQKELAAKERTIALDEYTNEFMSKLQELQNDTTNTLLYPQDGKFKTSLYGKDYKLIYSTLENPLNDLTQVTYTNNKVIRYVTQPQKYYLQTQYVVVEVLKDDAWLKETIKTIVLYSSLFFIIMVVLGYFLVRLFLKPMRDALTLLDTFIKDTTHELNTPVSTIMTNIELIDTDKIEDKFLLKSINRIEIGAKTISNIYDDLTYLVLNNKILSKNEEINIKELVEQRVEYFTTLATMKKIEIHKELQSGVSLEIDTKKLSKLIDNLLSNAIKYNKVGGTIAIHLDKNSLRIKDSGRGIKQEHIDSMFERYSRFDKSVGGFGIGLSIVKMICDEYNFAIKIESELNKFTEVSITF